MRLATILSAERKHADQPTAKSCSGFVPFPGVPGTVNFTSTRPSDVRDAPPSRPPVVSGDGGLAGHPSVRETFVHNVGMLGPEDMGVVLVVVAIVAIFTFGSSKIPQLARSLGQAKSEFKKGLSERPDAEAHDADQQTQTKADSQNNGSAQQS